MFINSLNFLRGKFLVHNSMYSYICNILLLEKVKLGVILTYKSKDIMKKLLFIAAFASLAFSSCTKENDIVVAERSAVSNNSTSTTNTESVVKHESKMITVQVTSGEGSSVKIASVAAAEFDNTYTKTYALTGNTVSVEVFSEIPSLKSIAIFVDGEMMTMRSASCASNDYTLTYEIGQ